MQPDRTSARRRQPRLGGRFDRAARLLAGRPLRHRRQRRGAGGYGTSSYIDQVVLRERDANTAWHLSSDGTLEERLYYCQNWRHDVVALVTANGQLRERIRYSSYGIPFGQPLGDCDGDGDVDAADSAILLGAWGTNTPKCDLNLDGTINATDQSTQLGTIGVSSAFAELTRNKNRLGYAGYAADSESQERWHARHRVLESKLGRWTARDPIEYADGASLIGYVLSSPVAAGDPLGLKRKIWVLEGIAGYQPDPSRRMGILSQPIARDFWLEDLRAAPNSDVYYKAQDQWREVVDEISAIAGQNIAPPTACQPFYHGIGIIGFSNGGAGAVYAQEELCNRGIKVDVVLTADPIPQSPLWTATS